MASPLGPEWNLSFDGIKIITDNGNIKDIKTILKTALNSDLKAIGKSTLPNELSKSKVGKVVLQIQKIRNISAPKAKEESQAAPRMLKLTLTDGESYVQAIESSPMTCISREKTAPGTKVLINGANVISGYLVITPQNFSILGGQVEHLYEKWILAKSVQQNHQHAFTTGAPPWVAFGGKIVTADQDKPFKSLEKTKEGGMDSEFEQQRKEAIAEVSNGAVRKTFGGRMKQNVQPTQHQTHNNKGRNNDRGDNERGGRRSKFISKEDDGVEKLQKPSEKVSLFSFLEDKLPIAESKKPAVPSPSCNKNNCQNYHQKDPRIQQKSEQRQNSKDTSGSTFRENTSASRAKPEVKSSFAMKNLPQNNNSENPKVNEPLQNVNNRNTTNSSGDGYNNRNNQQRYSKDQNNYSNKDTQQHYQHKSNYEKYYQQQNQGVPNRYRDSDDRYYQQPNSNNSHPRDNFNQFRNNTDRYPSHPPEPSYSKDHFNQPQNQMQPQNTSRQQYSNNYAHQNTQYNQKPQLNVMPGPQQNAELHQLANDLSKMSVSNEFASRSLRQHLNLGPPKRQENQQSGGSTLNIGDQCVARYWEDGKFYPATVAAITDKTYAVQFKGYGNIEEVLKNDCFSATNAYNPQQGRNNPNHNNYQQNSFSGNSMEFRSRRGPPRN